MNDCEDVTETFPAGEDPSIPGASSAIVSDGNQDWNLYKKKGFEGTPFPLKSGQWCKLFEATLNDEVRSVSKA